MITFSSVLFLLYYVIGVLFYSLVPGALRGALIARCTMEGLGYFLVGIFWGITRIMCLGKSMRNVLLRIRRRARVCACVCVCVRVCACIVGDLSLCECVCVRCVLYLYIMKRYPLISRIRKYNKIL